MFGRLARQLLLLAAILSACAAPAFGRAFHHLGPHRDDVDVTRYPWSAIGKLYNETGGSCSGAVIARDKILTAAHCLFNYRTQRFIPASALHFLVGYRTGRYSAHMRVASYEIGAGFDPYRYGQTSDADWAVLTVTEKVPASIEPLKLASELSPRGTKAMMAGYPRDRAHAMTADSDCELREVVDGGRLYLHTCRGIAGYSGAPILIRGEGDEVRVAGIQIAKFEAGGVPTMMAIPAEVIARKGRLPTGGDKPAVAAAAVVAAAPIAPVSGACLAPIALAYGRLVEPPAIAAHNEPSSSTSPRDVRLALAEWL